MVRNMDTDQPKEKFVIIEAFAGNDHEFLDRWDAWARDEAAHEAEEQGLTLTRGPKRYIDPEGVAWWRWLATVGR